MKEENRNCLQSIVNPLLDWYSSQKRILPWRDEPNDYKVWISEIMLQQTRVNAVMPYFHRFMERLPDMNSLANVEDQELLKLWEGLGYYNRARNLKKTAIIVMERYQGKLPCDYKLLLELPGIGSYTAGAVASIAYGIKVPAVDGNVLRVISRNILYEKDVLSQTAKKEIEECLQEIMPEDVASFNQALMELGALICVPNGMPKCEICPLQMQCLAYNRDCIKDYPKKSPKKPRIIEEKTVLVIKDADKTAIRKRPDGGLLGGLYEFPMMEGHVLEDQVIEYLKEFGLHTLRIQKIEPSKHIFSHKEWHMIGYEVRVDELAPLELSNHDFIFKTARDTEDKYPIPAAFTTYTKYLKIQLGIKKTD